MKNVMTHEKIVTRDPMDPPINNNNFISRPAGIRFSPCESAFDAAAALQARNRRQGPPAHAIAVRQGQQSRSEI